MMRSSLRVKFLFLIPIGQYVRYTTHFMIIYTRLWNNILKALDSYRSPILNDVQRMKHYYALGYKEYQEPMNCQRAGRSVYSKYIYHQLMTIIAIYACHMFNH